jgi:hypothetical protein
MVLMKGSDADATIDALVAGGHGIDIADEGPYWKLQSRGDIQVDMAAVEEELGAPIDIGRWLVTMTSFVGYAEKNETQFTVHAERGDAINLYPGGADIQR